MGWALLHTVKVCNKFEISMFTHYKDMKGDEKRKNWGGLEEVWATKIISNIAI